MRKVSKPLMIFIILISLAQTATIDSLTLSKSNGEDLILMRNTSISSSNGMGDARDVVLHITSLTPDMLTPVLNSFSNTSRHNYHLDLSGYQITNWNLSKITINIQNMTAAPERETAGVNYENFNFQIVEILGTFYSKLAQGFYNQTFDGSLHNYSYYYSTEYYNPNLRGNASLVVHSDYETATNIRGYLIEDPEWVVYSAMVAAEMNTESGIEAVKDRIEEEWDEITRIALRESLPATIEDFIDELEEVTTYRTKDSEDQAERIKSYFSLLGCMSEGMYGTNQLDTICAVEAMVAYYGDDVDEERLQELIDRFVQAYE